MSVQTEISRLNSAKSDVSSAITEKGVTVPTGTKLDGMAELIRGISSGGGGGSDVEYKITNMVGSVINNLPDTARAGETIQFRHDPLAPTNVVEIRNESNEIIPHIGFTVGYSPAIKFVMPTSNVNVLVSKNTGGSGSGSSVFAIEDFAGTNFPGAAIAGEIVESPMEEKISFTIYNEDGIEIPYLSKYQSGTIYYFVMPASNVTIESF